MLASSFATNDRLVYRPVILSYQIRPGIHRIRLHGSLWTVYLARQPASGHPVLVKAAHKCDFSSDEKQSEQDARQGMMDESMAYYKIATALAMGSGRAENNKSVAPNLHGLYGGISEAGGPGKRARSSEVWISVMDWAGWELSEQLRYDPSVR